MIEDKYIVVVFRSKLVSETAFPTNTIYYKATKNHHSFSSYIYNALNVSLIFHKHVIMKRESCTIDPDDIFYQDHWQLRVFYSEFYLCQTRYICNVSYCI